MNSHMIRLEYNIPSQVAQLEWVSDVIFNQWLGLCVKPLLVNRPGLRIAFGESSLELGDAYWVKKYDEVISIERLPEMPLKQWAPSESGLKVNLIHPTIPILYGSSGFHLVRPGLGKLNLDVLGSAYLMLSRWEEIIIPERDNHDRFPAVASVAYRGGFLERPLIDEYVEILWSAIQVVCPNLVRKIGKFQMAISHDVDFPSRYGYGPLGQVVRRGFVDLIKKRDPYTAMMGMVARYIKPRNLLRKDPYNTFDWLMSQSDALGIKSAFYFMCGRSNPQYDGPYELEDPAVRKLMTNIHSRGHECGLHPSYETYLKPDLLIEEALRLKKACEDLGIQQSTWGGRMHYLRWKTPETLYGWEQAGFDYESTLGYADRPGFRCGTCHEFSAFDPVARKQLRVRIRPLIVMECSVILDQYLGLGVGDTAKSKMLELKQACRAVGGTFTFLWHNSQFLNEDWKRLYRDILEG